jgi:hypothetical protein
MKRTVLLCFLAGTALLGRPRAAEAKLFDLYASGRAGQIWGWGISDVNAEASNFFDRVRGPSLGAEVGAEVFLVNLSVNFNQLFDREGPAGTLTQFLVGFDGDLAIDSRLKPKTFLRFGVSGGLALGTHRPVDPPLDNNQVSNKGPVAQGLVALDRHLNSVFIIGLEFIGGYHYFFAGGDAPANAKTNQSQGAHVMGFLSLRVHFEPGQ